MRLPHEEGLQVMLERLRKVQWKKQFGFYGVVIGICLILAAGINTLMDQGPEDRREKETLRNLKSELEHYRRVQGDRAKKEDLLKIWKSYEGKLSPEEIETLKSEYRTKLDPAEVEALQKAYEDMKRRKP